MSAGGAVPEQVAGRVAELFGARVLATGRVGGGDTGEALQVRLVPAGGMPGTGTVGPDAVEPLPAAGATVFVKTHRLGTVGLLSCEAEGLRWLAETATVRVPRVLAVCDEPARRGTAPTAPFLVLEWIATGPPGPTHDDELGRGLAELHRVGAARFGGEHDNFIGPLPQCNEPAPTWAELYGRRRIVPLVERAVAEGRLAPDARSRAERLTARLDDLCGPPEPPARLHGDLWAGNALADDRGRPVLVDPAVYGGHREVDLAMMRLFGGFGPAVFRAYDEVHPLAAGHEDRVALYQLYPLLVHTLLFGGGYAARAAAVLGRYT